MSRDIRVVSVTPTLAAYVAWGEEHRSSVDLGDTLAAFQAGWKARDAEVARLQGEIAQLKDEAMS